MIIPIEMISSHHIFPASKFKENGGRKIKNIIRVIKNDKGKLTPI